MLGRIIALSAFSVCLATAAAADQAEIDSIVSAGPVAVTKDATIMRWNGEILRKGANGWTCLPNSPGRAAAKSVCVDTSWQNFLATSVDDMAPSYDEVGFTYMLVAQAPNGDTASAGKNVDGEWAAGQKAYLAVRVPDKVTSDSVPAQGGASDDGVWVRWPNTPYAHIMLPIDSYARD